MLTIVKNSGQMLYFCNLWLAFLRIDYLLLNLLNSLKICAYNDALKVYPSVAKYDTACNNLLIKI